MDYWPASIFISYLGVVWFGALPSIYIITIWLYNKGILKVSPIPKNRLKPWMMRWNGFMSLSSFIGFCLTYRHFPGIYHMWISECGTCEKSWILDHWVDTWTVVFFMLLKPLKVIDTLFLMLNNKSISRLHWIHHTTVTLYCWHTAVYSNAFAGGSLFALMNYFVHAVMYTYYGLRSAEISLPKYFAIVITTLQIVQMVMGLLIMLQVGLRCSWDVCNPINILFGLVIYGAYFYLFCKYFLQRYIIAQYK